MDGRSASEKEGRFSKIKKVVSFSSDGLKRHKVLVVLDQVRREGEDETDYSVCLSLAAALELFTRLAPISVSIFCLSLSPQPSQVYRVRTQYFLSLFSLPPPPPHLVPAAREERGSAKVTISNTRKGHLLIFLPLSALRVRPLYFPLAAFGVHSPFPIFR